MGQAKKGSGVTFVLPLDTFSDSVTTTFSAGQEGKALAMSLGNSLGSNCNWVVGCCWMLLDVVGSCWMLLDVVGRCWTHWGETAIGFWSLTEQPIK